ncbi:dynein light chain Tctex-type 4 [Rana temporaria]|uniref:dynein light chain Tctex-type 4 n=1 Tax=Rana temporaria TaxID=8407 RepID=UPI001AAC4E8B|nr:dynein light chain Tctex-type 4 [Rana temporaria]
MMEDPPDSLPQAVLAQLSQVAEETSSRSAALVTRRSSHCVEMMPRTLVRLRSIEERRAAFSRRSSVVSNVPFSRKNSLCATGPNRRLSIGPWAHFGRVSFSGLPLYPPIQEIRYENTYRTGPDRGFNLSWARRVLEAVLRNHLTDMDYSAASGGQRAQNLSDLIRSRMKEQCPPRYKVLCHVIMGQMGNQGLRVASRSLWDPQTDNFASATYSNATLFAVAMVHASYYE